MKDLKGFDRDRWKTGFTNYRYAIPDLAGKAGRAIYNDVDQVYLADPAELFDMDMQGAGQLCISERETAVMLLDCEKMAKIWQRPEAERGDRKSVVEGKSVSVRVELGGRRTIRKKKKQIEGKRTKRKKID